MNPFQPGSRRIALAILLGFAPAAHAVDRNEITVVADTANQDEGDFAEVEIGVDGMPVIAYYNRSTGNLMLARCGNLSCTSVASLATVDATDDVGNGASMALDAAGLPVISYANLTLARIQVAFCADPGCTAGTVVRAPSQLAVPNLSARSRIAMIDGAPAILYSDFVASDLMLLRCSNASCTAFPVQSPVLIDGSGFPSEVVLAEGSDARPAMAWRANLDQVRFAHCTAAGCGSTINVATLADEANTLGGSVAIAIGDTGFPVVAYTDDDDGLLRVAACLDLDCATPVASNLVYDSAGSVEDVSMRINNNGRPVIAFYERGAGPSRLLVASCAALDCAGPKLVTVIGEGGNRGGVQAGTTDLAIGTDGRPVIAYYQSEDNQVGARLMLARCSRPNCDDSPVFDDGFE